ncbi:MAG: hypothetical protein R2774_08590 [Saprospiraceae bacterium]
MIIEKNEFITSEELRLLLSKALNADVQTLEVESREIECGPGVQSAGCFPDQYVSGFSVDYLGCMLTVSYNVRICFTGSGVMQLSVWNLDIDDSDPSCTALLTHWANLQAAGQIHQLAKERNEMYTAVVKEIEMNILVPISQLIVIECGSQNSAYNVSFYENDCTATCFTYKLDGGISVYETKCGDMCCKRVSQYCLNEKGELEPVGTPSIVSLNGNCTAPTSQCLQSVEGVCTSPCSRIGADVQ